MRIAHSAPPGAQRPKASEGESVKRTCPGETKPVVLNARRHRRGNQIRRALDRSSVRSVRCSTPEGIGGGIRVQTNRARSQERVSAQRPKASEGESGSGLPSFRLSGGSVLNARRHRRGNQMSRVATACRPSASAQRPKASEGESVGLIDCRDSLSHPVLNARRHRRGNQPIDKGDPPYTVRFRAQRPKASEGESGLCLVA